MTIILIEDVNSNDLEILLEDSVKGKADKIRSSLRLLISHMLKYKHKGYLQTNSWIETIINNYNNICNLIKTKAVFHKLSEDEYNELYNKIYEKSEKEQGMIFNEINQLITYIDLINLNNFDIKKFLFDYNVNKDLINTIKNLKKNSK